MAGGHGAIACNRVPVHSGLGEHQHAGANRCWGCSPNLPSFKGTWADAYECGGAGCFFLRVR